MATEGILFDLGGVICGFDRDRRSKALADACGLSPSTVTGRLYGSGFIRDCDLGLYDSAGMARWIRHSFKFTGTLPELAALWSQAFDLDRDVLDIAWALRRGRRLGLLTNNDALLLEALPQAFPEIAEVFDFLLFSCVLHACKPARAAFSRALEPLGTAAAATLFIDDAPGNVAAAQELGLQPVLFTSAGQLARELEALGVR